MKIITVLLLLLLFGQSPDKNDCKFENGRYQIVYDKIFSTHPKYIAVIENDNFNKIWEDREEHFKINWLSGSSFILEPTFEPKEPLTEIAIQLNTLGQRFYDIKRCGNNQIHFEYKQNLHITINSGIFIRIED